MTAVTLYRFDRIQQVLWFYLLKIYIDLLGYSCLDREWGRVGQQKRFKKTVFENFESACNAMERCRSRIQFDIEFITLQDVERSNSAYCCEKLYNNFLKDHMYKERSVKNCFYRVASDACYDETPIIGLKSIESSAERIKLSDNPKEALLSERVIDVFTRNLGFGTCTFLLDQAGIVTVEDLVGRSDYELRAIRGIGKKKLAMIKAELADFGLSLRRQQQISMKLEK